MSNVLVRIVSADKCVAADLERDLRRHQIAVETFTSGRDALGVVSRCDITLLDLDLPDLDGVEFIRRSNETPVIAITSSSSEVVRVLALQAGADDCVVRPYMFRELLSRIEAVNRRVRSNSRQRHIRHGSLILDLQRRIATVDGTEICLTEKEFDLLELLSSQSGNVVDRAEIMGSVWGDSWNRKSRTVDTHVSSLRSKLPAGSWISTVRGVGFRFHPANSDEDSRAEDTSINS